MKQPVTFKLIETGKIRPLGWLSTQLERQLQGYAEDLDRFCAEAGSDIFGRNKVTNPQDRHWWNAETEGNWIDGFVRLAFLSGNQDAILKARKYIKHILETQESDGYIGVYSPELRYKKLEDDGEFWAQSRTFSAMLAYYEATGEREVLVAVGKAALLDVSHYGPYAEGRSYFGYLYPDSHGVMLAEPMLQLYDLTGDRRFLNFAVFCYDDFSANYNRSYGSDCRLGYLLDKNRPFISHGAHTCEHLRIPLLLYGYTEKIDYRKAFENGMEKMRAVRWDCSPTHDDAVVCCVPNAVRAVPYQIGRMWMRTNEGGLVALLYGPCTVTERINGNRIEVEETTGYPFDEIITIKIRSESEKNFPVRFRIPDWSAKTVIRIDDREKEVGRGEWFFTIRRSWKDETVITIQFYPEIETVKAVDGTVAVRRGVLLYALPIPHRRVVTKRYPTGDDCDFDILPEEGAYWAYDLLLDRTKPNSGLVFCREEGKGYPWDSSSVLIQADAIETTPNYAFPEKMDQTHREYLLLGSPRGPVTMNLVPIGCTVLRKTSFNSITL